MNRVVRFLIGSAVLVAVLLAVGWFDSVVMVAAQNENRHTFNIDPILLSRAGGYLLVAASILVIALTGWRFRSVELGLAYLLAGAFFTFLDTITWKLAAAINDAPPVLPPPLVTAVGWFYGWEQGPMSGTLIVGAGTLLVGLALVASRLVSRTRLAPASRVDDSSVPRGLEGQASGQVNRA